MDIEEPIWLLGFAENSAPVKLLRHHFPSKAGGRPAWLDPVDLPNEDQLRCPLTGGLRNFLLQIYAPVFDISDAFHRTIFVFVSPKGSEVAKNGGCTVFRSQMPRLNPFYSPVPPMNKDLVPIPLPENCVIHDPWKVAEYEKSFLNNQEHVEVLGGLQLFPESNLSVVEESLEAEVISEQTISSVSNTMSAPIIEEEFSSVEQLLDKDQSDFMDFQDRIQKAPDQCVRYCFEDGAEPLWPNKQQSNLQQEDIPNCERCGAPRKFELQILPQLINYLDANPLDPDSYDWGTIVIYSCSESCSPKDNTMGCSGSQAYIQEFAFVQPM